MHYSTRVKFMSPSHKTLAESGPFQLLLGPMPHMDHLNGSAGNTKENAITSMALAKNELANVFSKLSSFRSKGASIR